MKKISFILNPNSGTQSKLDIPNIINEVLDHEKFEHTVYFTEYAGHASVLAKELSDDGTDIVVAVGGDGTVNEVARSLVHTDTALGIIPCGSGNGLARHLCLPLDVREALGIINHCKIERLDYGVINDLPFFCTCGMGFDAFISMKFAEAGKRGMVTYLENVLKEGLKYKPETYVVEDESGTHKYNAFLIACANASQYGNNAYIAPSATMRDGLLDVIIMEPFNLLDAPQVSFDMLNRTLNNNSKIKAFRAKSIHIKREKEGAIHYDGDPIITGKDIDIHIESAGISIVTNPEHIEDDSQPNPLLNIFSEFFNNINNVREDIEKDIEKRGRRIQTVNKLIMRKLAKL